MDMEVKIEEFIALRASGLSFEKISKQIKISKPTLITWSRKYEAEIHNEKMSIIDSLKDTYGRTKESRVQILSTLTDKLMKEFSGRDLGDVPADKLLKMAISIQNQLDAELSGNWHEDVEFDLEMKKTRRVWPL